MPCCAGIKYVTFDDVCAAEPTAAALAQCAEPDRLAALKLDPSIGAVVIGWDPRFDYARLCYASACLRELPGCLFVGTNLDAADKMGELRGWEEEEEGRGHIQCPGTLPSKQAPAPAPAYQTCPHKPPPALQAPAA